MKEISMLIVESVLSSTFTGSWYLTSSIVGAAVVFFVSKKLSSTLCTILLYPLFILCVISSVYYGLLPATMQHILSGMSFPANIFCGIFYFSLGKLIADTSEYWAKKSARFYYSIAILAFLLFLCEVYFAKAGGYYRVSDQGLFIAPVAFFLFLGCVQNPFYSPKGVVWRKISTIIYCAQGNVLLVAALFMKVLDVQASFVKCLMGLIMMLFVVLAVLFVTFRYSRRFRVLRYLT